MFITVENCMKKVNYLLKTGAFSPVRNYLRHFNNSRQLIFNTFVFETATESSLSNG